MTTRTLFALLSTVTVACTSTNVDSPATSYLNQPPILNDLPQKFTVTSAYVFLPKWAGAEGFSAGGKYVIQGEMFSNEDRSKLSDADRVIGLPADGSGAIAFEVVGASLQTDNVEVRATAYAGPIFTGEEANLWLVHDDMSGNPYDLSKGRLVKALGEAHHPNGEAEHALKVAIDLSGDGKPDYAEFSHHCKAEKAPYPIDDAGRTAWEAEHGEVDWDYTCSNVYTIRAGKWTQEARKTPM